MMRIFAALPLDVKSREQIMPFIQYGRNTYGNIKWVAKENLHITLFFFGERDIKDAEDVMFVLKGLAEGFKAIHIEYGGMGRFPAKGEPRIIFAPLLKGEEQCRKLYTAGYAQMHTRFNLDNRIYRPHITLGRAKRGKKPGQPGTDPYFAGLKGSFTCDSIILYESVLSPAGPVYNELATFGLQS